MQHFDVVVMISDAHFLQCSNMLFIVKLKEEEMEQSLGK